MENNQARPQNMIDITDALEAVSACQSMKNFLFVLILLGLVICQIVFWMDHFGLVNKKECSACDRGAEAVCPIPCQTACPAGMPSNGQCPQGDGKKAICPTPCKTACPARAAEVQCPEETKPQATVPSSGPIFLAATTDGSQPTEPAAEQSKTIEQAIDEIVKSANQPPQETQDTDVILEKFEKQIPAEIVENSEPAKAAEPESESKPAETVNEIPTKKELFHISSSFAEILISICNFIILTAAILYCLSLLVCLKISLAGRLGGINHMARAFFISLFLLVVLIPWQTVLPGVLIGTVWLPGALGCECWAKADSSAFWKVVLYLRFCGLFLVAVWLLLWTQIRSAKWARATLRRLGVAR